MLDSTRVLKGPDGSGAPRQRVGYALFLILVLPLVAVGQQSDRDDPWANRDPTLQMLPTGARLAIWTDSPGYTTRWHSIRAFLAMHPRGDKEEYATIVYLESLETGKRWYWRGLDALQVFSQEKLSSRRLRGPIPRLEPTRIWWGRLEHPGLWRFVAELRSPDQTQLVKRATAGFLISWKVPLEVGRNGTPTEIAEDTFWGTDRIRTLRGPVFIRQGATLRLGPGTLVLARGPEAVIVVERGGRIEALGTPDAPVVLTCDGPAGQREPGCWGGLVLLGRAPAHPWNARAAGVEPRVRGRYGGDDQSDSSGVLRHVRVEFAGAAPFGAGIGFHGVGSGTVIDHVQAHDSGADGIRLSGGTANCLYCVSSGALGHGLSWHGGWSGAMQHAFVQQPASAEGCGIAGDREADLPSWSLKRLPRLINVTLAGTAEASCTAGVLLRHGSRAILKNVLVSGFKDGAMRIEDPLAATLSPTGASFGPVLSDKWPWRAVTLTSGAPPRLVRANLRLTNMRHEAGMDPRPGVKSPALRVGMGAVPPADGILDPRADYVGAFGRRNWLEGWTILGPEEHSAPVEAGPQISDEVAPLGHEEIGPEGRPSWTDDMVLPHAGGKEAAPEADNLPAEADPDA